MRDKDIEMWVVGYVDEKGSRDLELFEHGYDPWIGSS